METEVYWFPGYICYQTVRGYSGYILEYPYFVPVFSCHIKALSIVVNW